MFAETKSLGGFREQMTFNSTGDSVTCWLTHTQKKQESGKKNKNESKRESSNKRVSTKCKQKQSTNQWKHWKWKPETHRGETLKKTMEMTQVITGEKHGTKWQRQEREQRLYTQTLMRGLQVQVREKKQKSTGRRENHTEGGTESRHAFQNKTENARNKKRNHDLYNIPNFLPYSTPPIFWGQILYFFTPLHLFDHFSYSLRCCISFTYFIRETFTPTP